MNRKRSSSSNYSEVGNEKSETLDVCDVPDRLAQCQIWASEIAQRSTDPEIKRLARHIELALDPAITAMANAVEQLAELAEVA